MLSPLHHSHDDEVPGEVADEEHGDGGDEDDGHVGLARLRRRLQLPLHRRLGALPRRPHRRARQRRPRLLTPAAVAEGIGGGQSVSLFPNQLVSEGKRGVREGERGETGRSEGGRGEREERQGESEGGRGERGRERFLHQVIHTNYR